MSACHLCRVARHSLTVSSRSAALVPTSGERPISSCSSTSASTAMVSSSRVLSSPDANRRLGESRHHDSRIARRRFEACVPVDVGRQWPSLSSPPRHRAVRVCTRQGEQAPRRCGSCSSAARRRSARSSRRAERGGTLIGTDVIAMSRDRVCGAGLSRVATKTWRPSPP